MSAFALGDEVRQLLRAPEDPRALTRAQNYTQDFAAIKGIFEGLYIATPDTHVLTHTSKDAGYQEIIQLVREGSGLQASTYSDRDEQGKNRLVVYKYLKDRGWIFMVREDAAEVYRSVTTVRLVVGVVCAAIAGGIILVVLLILRREGRELMVGGTGH